MSRMTDLGMSGTPVELEMAGQIAAQTGLGNPYAGTMLEVTRRAQEMPGYASGLRQGNVYSGYSPQFMTDESVMRSYMNPYTKLVTDP